MSIDSEYALFDTALGRCAIAWTGRGIRALMLPEADSSGTVRRLLQETGPAKEARPPAWVEDVMRRIRSHVSGSPQSFSDVRLDLDGAGPFRRSVYAAARGIPGGSLLGYGELAARIGSPKAARAVGAAMGRNPIPILVPCHRVVGAGKSPGGFSAFGGLSTKARLLRAEGADLPSSRRRCSWAEGVDDIYLAYHDTEWGVPVHDDRKHFEFLILEGAQAGLSWITILRKREAYREAFAGFDPGKVARFGPREIRKLMNNPGIVRNRLKISAAVSNARAFLGVQKEFGSFDAHAWRFVGGRTIQGRRRTVQDIPATSPESDALSRDLKKRGFKFVGSTILYAHMQAVGMVNDHVVDCFRSRELR
jgi:DNA-3-methyladenine glycosylase I